MGSGNQSVNTPSKVYPVVNALTKVGSASSTLAEGNTKATVNDNGGIVITPKLPFSGLWYFEINVTTNVAWYPGIGQQSALGYNSTNAWGTTTPETHVWLTDHPGNYFNNNGSLSTYPKANPTTGRFAVAWDGDNRALYFGQISGSTITWTNSGDPTSGSSKTGAAPGNWPTTGTDPLYFIVLGGGTSVMEFDFDEDDWTGSTNRPADAKALNSENLTAPDYQGIDYFDTTLYEGNGQGQRVGDFVPYTDTYTVSNSAMWYSEDIRKLKYNYSSEAAATSDTTKQATLSFWIKFVETADTDQQVFLSQSDSSQQNRFMMYVSGTNSEDDGYVMIQVSNVGYSFKFNKHLFNKDAWSHCLLHLDTDNSTAADRMKLWIDGVPVINRQTGSSAYTNLPQGSDLNIFRDTLDLFVGHLSPGSTYGSTYNFNSYLAEYHLIDGSLQSLTNFGEIDTSTNRWVPKDYKTNVGTYGNRGFYLKFDGTPGASTGSNMGKDSSGNGLNLTEEFGSGGSAWATTDKFADTPSKNFVTFDTGLNAMGTLSEGGTKIVTATNNKAAYTTMNIPSTGKWYWEVDMTSYASGGGAYFGLHEHDELNTGSAGVTSTAVIFQNYNGTANVYDSSNSDVTWCNSVSADGFVSSGDVLQFALDQDAGTLFIGNNNTWFRAGGARDTFANATTVGTKKFPTGISRRFFVGRGGSFAETYALNFGQQSSEFSGSSTTFNAAADGYFVYTPPTDYKALNQDNLDDTASKITAWAWIKNRDASSDHMLFDRIRGVNKDIHTNSTDAEVTNQSTLQRFLQRGVQVGADSAVNTASNSFVLWQWLLGDSATTGSTNSNGSLDTSVIAADAGHFSIVSWTMSDPAGAKTLGHGLTAAPELIIIKNRTDSSTNWPVYSEAAGNTKYQYLSTTATATTFNMWQDTSPDEDVFSVSSNNEASGSANDEMIAYCFRSVPGVCKVGKYQVNNVTDDGPYVSLGFKPRWIMFKGLDIASQWTIYDSVRQPFNVGDHIFSYVNLNSADQAFAANDIDMLSDGFKIRADTNNEPNNGSGEYLYLAMADIGGNGTLPPIYGR